MFRTSAKSYGVILLGLLLGCEASQTTTPLGAGDAAPPPDAGTGPFPTEDAGPPTTGDAGADAQDASVVVAQKKTKLVVVYPAGGKALEVRGSVAPLSWDVSTPMKPLGNDTFEFSVDEGAGAFEWKPLLAGTWSRGPNYRAAK